jgi:hypothetical protein
MMRAESCERDILRKLQSGPLGLDELRRLFVRWGYLRSIGAA